MRSVEHSLRAHPAAGCCVPAGEMYVVEPRSDLAVAPYLAA